ncbi:MAG: O-antigen ligase family protein [Anaerolineae bacterium]
MFSLRAKLGDLSRFRAPALVVLVLLSAGALGRFPRQLYLALPLGGVAGLLLIWKPALGLGLLVSFALVLPREFSTGSEVVLNVATLLVPALLVLWVADILRRGEVHIAPTATNRPLLLFVLAGLLSLVVGNALWDPTVPRPTNMTVVQFAQWSIIAFSSAAFWLMANLASSETALRRLTWLFLGIAGVTAVVRVLPGGGVLLNQVATEAVTRSPFWMLLAALSGGQLLFNRELAARERGYLIIVVAAVLYYAFIVDRSVASTWISVSVVAALLVWFRYPRVRRPMLVLALLASPFVLPRLFEFGGGEAEWEQSGGSRLVLIGRVIEVTLHNPITGLGPASYRPYANVQPLSYGGAYWVNPQISSHNNYVDLLAHFGLLGLGLFLWFVRELLREGWRLVQRVTGGFAAGYAHGALAALVGSLALMMFADWILPFVYNIGFPGFQAGVLVWLFLGGLVSVAQWNEPRGLA